MISDLLDQINEVLESEDNQEGSSKGRQEGSSISVGDIINNQGTIIIGGTHGQGDPPGASNAPDIDPDRVCSEVRDLHSQLTQLKHRLTCLYGECVKRCTPRRRACLKSSGQSSATQGVVSNRRNSHAVTAKLSTDSRKPAPRLASRPAITHPIPPNPIPFLVSFSLTPHIEQSPIILRADTAGVMARRFMKQKLMAEKRAVSPE